MRVGHQLNRPISRINAGTIALRSINTQGKTTGGGDWMHIREGGGGGRMETRRGGNQGGERRRCVHTHTHLNTHLLMMKVSMRTANTRKKLSSLSTGSAVKRSPTNAIAMIMPATNHQEPPIENHVQERWNAKQRGKEHTRTRTRTCSSDDPACPGETKKNAVIVRVP